MVKKVFLSTAIPYVNGAPHAGHTLEFVQADVIARYHRLLGDKVYLLSGTDENALKNVLAAEKAGKSTQEFVDENTSRFCELKDLLNISLDGFIRTTEQRHFDGTQKLWLALKKEDIYLDEYEGLYCVGCEEFKNEKDLTEDGECPEHKTKLEIVREKNYFFKLSNYQEQIEQLIRDNKLVITPEKRKNEVLGFLREGLRDFSISRSNERARNWGVPVPNDDSQRIYVWLDALGNYLTGLDYATSGELYEHFWTKADQRIHVIGKGIVKFHALYWIGILLSAGLPLPTEEFVHGYVTVEGNKIGKSLGNTIDPHKIVERYGADALRYYLLKEIPAYSDGDFSWARMEEVYKADLQNGLGNIVSRVAAMSGEQKFEIRNLKFEISTKIGELLSKYQFDEAMGVIWKQIKKADQFVSNKRVWELGGEEKVQAMSWLVREIKQIATNLEPFLPATAEKIRVHFSQEKIGKIAPLFPRLS